jgi:hypothetical protein
MYSFASRPDTQVMDEPFYGYYLDQTGSDHPGRDEILESMDCNWETIVKNINDQKGKSDIIFVKNMAHHLLKDDLSFMDGWMNLYLIRDPKQIVASFSQVIEMPLLKDIGSKQQAALFRRAPGIVIDSNELLKNPKLVLLEMCSRLGIPFYDQMLQWQSGPIKEDGIWSKYWYKNVHASTGFEKQNKKKRELNEELTDVAGRALPYFNELFKHAIKADHATKIRPKK